MGRGKHRVNLTLDSTAHEFFTRSGSKNGKSGYVSDIIIQRWREWTRALALLRAHGGLTTDEIRDAIVRLNPQWELRDIPACRAVLRDLHAKRNLSDAHIYALCSLCAEWWAGNNELSEILSSKSRRNT